MPSSKTPIEVAIGITGAKRSNRIAEKEQASPSKQTKKSDGQTTSQANFPAKQTKKSDGKTTSQANSPAKPPLRIAQHSSPAKPPADDPADVDIQADNEDGSVNENESPPPKSKSPKGVLSLGVKTFGLLLMFFRLHRVSSKTGWERSTFGETKSQRQSSTPQEDGNDDASEDGSEEDNESPPSKSKSKKGDVMLRNVIKCHYMLCDVIKCHLMCFWRY
jgi:hypothetical protein